MILLLTRKIFIQVFAIKTNHCSFLQYIIYIAGDSDDCTKIKEQSHYSEITDQMAADKLNVYLPKYDNAEYEKCNIAKSKLGPVDTAQYLDVCESSKGVYDSVSGDEMGCNAMNEQFTCLLYIRGVNIIAVSTWTFS
jgi:hypothetical protein